MKKVLVHGSGHGAASWDETVKYMRTGDDICCPDLSVILNEKEAVYSNLYAAFAEYCNRIDGQIDLCGISLGGILALDYAINFPEKVRSLVLIGTPHKVPKGMFAIQNIIFRFLPESVFVDMAFNKRDTFVLGNSLKNLDFSNSVQYMNCPVLIICGEKDRANMKSAHYLAEHIKGAKEEIIENAGHVVNEEKPQMLARILDEFWGHNLEGNSSAMQN